MFKDISPFLSKFTKITPPHKSVQKAVSQVIKDILGVSLEPKEIEVSNDVVYIKTESVLKNEIFLNKTQILEEVEKKLSTEKRVVKDVR